MFRILFVMVMLFGVYTSMDTGETMIIERDNRGITTVMHSNGNSEMYAEIN